MIFYYMSCSKSSKCNQSIINSVRAFSQAENPLRYLIEVGVNEGLYWGTVWVPHDQSPGDACVEGCVFEKGRGGEFFRPCMFAFHISCWNCRTTQWGSDPWVMCVVSPPLPGISKELPKRMQRTTLCDIYRHYSSVTSYPTTFPISLHFQWSWPIYLCCGEINLDAWIGGKGKKQRRKLH